MRAIIDFQNLSPALKDAMLTYVARLRTGRLITGLAAITLIKPSDFPTSSRLMREELRRR
jgi:hypothetical protein